MKLSLSLKNMKLNQSSTQIVFPNIVAKKVVAEKLSAIKHKQLQRQNV